MFLLDRRICGSKRPWSRGTYAATLKKMRVEESFSGEEDIRKAEDIVGGDSIDDPIAVSFLPIGWEPAIVGREMDYSDWKMAVIGTDIDWCRIIIVKGLF